jgi:glycerol-3-phosphate acyltransferase PlsY
MKAISDTTEVTLNNILVFTGLLLGGYLSGSFRAGWLIGKIFYHRDLFQEGSGGMGATNAWRLFGWKAGIPAFLLDVIKGVLPVIVAAQLGYALPFQILVGIASIVGHAKSIFVGFRGGKVVATSLGVLIALNWYVALVCFLIFLCGFIPSGIVALGSIMAAFSAPVVALLITHNVWMVGLTILLAPAVLFLHRKNIARIRTDEEIPMFHWRQLVARLLMPQQLRTGRHCILTIHVIGKGKRSSRKACIARSPLGYLVPGWLAE